MGLRKAGLTADNVDYVNCHATSTGLGDKAETMAIKKALGDRAYQIPVSSTKSMIGHTFGAAGAIEGMACIFALRDGILPPTINVFNQDPDCDLDVIPNEARHQPIRVAVNNSFGFGGHNACLVLTKYE
jgi:3-oxoacyl-[acyl-carrier-protein] synthase II